MAGVLLDSGHSMVQNGRANTIDLTHSGQQGAMRDPQNWMAQAIYVKQKVIPVLLQAPGAMRYMPDGDHRARMLKALVEIHAHSIQGLNGTYTAEFAESPVGNSGEQMETVTRVSRERSVPQFAWYDRKGKPVSSFWKSFMEDLMMDPETGHPGIVKYESYQAAGAPELLPDMVSFAVLFIEPSDNLGGVNNAVLVANMMPKSVSSEMSKVMGEANEMNALEIEFTGLSQYGSVISRMASDYLKSLNKLGYAPASLRPMAAGIAPNVADNAAPVGYRPGVQKVAAAL